MNKQAFSPHKKRILAGSVSALVLLCSSVPMATLSHARQAEATGVENILRAVRSWPSSGAAQGIDTLVTHSIKLTGAKPGTSRLPATEHDGVLRGEDAQANWPFYLTKSDLRAPVTISIRFTNAVTVLPEASKLSLSVNGRQVATKALRYPDEAGMLEIQVPPILLKAGENELTLRADQHHRIDCSLEGTYELWTTIDLQNSTINVANSQQRFTHISELSALDRGIDQSVAVNLVLPEQAGLSMSQKEQLLTLTQRAVLAAKIKEPAIQVIQPDNVFRSNGAALDLFVGSYTQLRQHSGLREFYSLDDNAAIFATQNQNVLMIPSKSQGRVLLAKLQEIAHLPDAFSFLQKDEHQELEETSISLNELGVKEREFFGQNFSEKIQLTLPVDFYAADYDSIDFHLFASYAKQIKSGELELRVNNGRRISVPVHKSNEGIIKDRVVKIPLSAFTPGKNEVEIVGLFNRNEDAAECATRINRSREALFFLSGESYFKVPELAHMPILPNVRTTLQTGFPYRKQDDGGPIALEMHGDIVRGLKFSAEFLSRMAINSQELFEVAVSGSALGTQSKTDNRIVVGSYSAMPTRYTKFQKGVDLVQLAQASQKQNALPPLVDMTPTASIGNGLNPDDGQLGAEGFSGASYQSIYPYQAMPAVPARSGSSLANETLKESFRRRANTEREGIGLKDVSDSITAILNPIFGAIAGATGLQGGEHPLDGGSKILIAQKQSNDEVTTLVSYDMQAASYFDLGKLFQSSKQGSGPIHTLGTSGFEQEIIQLRVDDGWLGNLPIGRAKNWDLVIAGWLSNNPLFYAGLTIFSLFGFGVLSSMILNRTKRSQGADFEQTY